MSPWRKVLLLLFLLPVGFLALCAYMPRTAAALLTADLALILFVVWWWLA